MNFKVAKSIQTNSNYPTPQKMTSIVCEVDSRLKAERNEQDQQRHSLQFVPAKIEFNGAEKIGPFFNDFIKDNQDGSFSTALRGRPLTGLFLAFDVNIYCLHKIDNNNFNFYM